MKHAPLPRPKMRAPIFLREVLDRIILIVAIYALINMASVRYVVDGMSMEPNFHDQEYLIVSRINYLLGEPEMGDIIVFHFPDNPLEDYIKRVIGVPGDVVEMRDTYVFVNGNLIEEAYINEPCTVNSCSDRVWQLGPDEFFVMGDNRNRSSDSRAFGPVGREFIIGEVVFRYWPLENIGLMHQYAFTD
ncbi:MAG: signal peptidase I [Anaerolineaceae bacterium]|nr:signal peptidase I [Anaerolineaceae bacterium]